MIINKLIGKKFNNMPVKSTYDKCEFSSANFFPKSFNKNNIVFVIICRFNRHIIYLFVKICRFNRHIIYLFVKTFWKKVYLIFHIIDWFYNSDRLFDYISDPIINLYNLYFSFYI